MSLPFLETPRFPEGLSHAMALSSEGGVTFNNRVIITGSGDVKVNQGWLHPIRLWNVVSSPQQQESVYEKLQTFILVIRGNTYAFRFKDWTDYRSVRPTLKDPLTPTDQSLGVGNGTQTVFQLQKTYTVGSLSYVRPIKKPVPGTVLVSVNNILVTTGFTIDHTTGLITFASAPGSGIAVKAGFEFDIPAMFEGDPGRIALRTPDANEMQELKVREIPL